MLTVTVTDDGNPARSDTAVITVNVLDTNRAPVANDTSGSLAEDVEIGTLLTKVTATDSNAGDVLRFAIPAGNTGSAFEIDRRSGDITTATALDYETTPSYTLTITVTDSGGLTDTATVQVTIIDIIDEAPPVKLETNTISVNFFNDAVYLLPGVALGVNNWNNFWTDNSGTAKSTQHLLYSSGSNSGATLAVNAQNGFQDSVNTATPESTLESSYWDTGPGTSNGQLTLSKLPASLSSDGYYVILYMRGTNAIFPNSAVEFGARIGNQEKWLRWVRNKVNGTFTFSSRLTETAAQFSQDDHNAILLNNNGAYYTAASLTIDILRDPDFSFDYQDWGRAAVSGLQIVPAPKAANATFTVAEDRLIGSSVGKVGTSLVDGKAPSLSITAGNGAGLFAIQNTGEIIITHSLDFETTAQHVLQVTATDVNQVATTAQVIVKVTDVNDAPIVIDNSASIAEDAFIGSAVVTVSASDVDAGDTMSFAITAGNTGNAFTIDSNGNITTATALDHATTPSYTLTVSVTDSGSLTDTATVVITVIGPPIVLQETNTISVNFRNSPTYNVVGSALGVSNWNNFETDNGGTVKNLNQLLYSSGSNSGAIVTVDSQHGWQDSVNNATPESILESSYWDTGTGNGQLTMTSLPSSLSTDGYYVMLYMRGTDIMGANSAAEFGARIGSEEKWLRWLRNQVSGTFTFGSHATEAAAQSSSDDQNAILLNNRGAFFKSTALAIDILRDPDTADTWGRAAVSGLQIVPAPTVGVATFAVAEDIAIGATVGTLVTNIVDGNAPALSITAGNGAGHFAIQSNGEITITSNLSYGTTPQYVLEVTATDVNQMTATAQVIVNVTALPAGFASWIEGFATDGLSGFDDDADFDGIPNGLEFVLGGDPTLANDSPLPTFASGAGDTVTYSFVRADRARGVVNLLIQVSENLVTWPHESEIAIGINTASSGSEVGITDMGDRDAITVTLPASATKMFLRLKVSDQ